MLCQLSLIVLGFFELSCQRALVLREAGVLLAVSKVSVLLYPLDVLLAVCAPALRCKPFNPSICSENSKTCKSG